MGILYLRQHKFGEALRCFDLALEINPYSLAARNNRGNTLKDLGDYAGASAEYAQALDLNPKHVDTLYNLALCHQQNGDMPLAMTRLGEIVEIAPAHEPARIQIIESLINLGRFAEAGLALEKLLDEMPQSAQAWYLKASLHKYERFDRAIFTPIIDLLATGKCDNDASLLLNFALGKLFDDIGEYDKAFEHYALANKARRQCGAYDRTAELAFTEHLLRSRARDWRPSVDRGREIPKLIFIVGMPRSGTTLVEQILSVHSDVTAVGEVDYFGPASRRLELDRDREIDLRILEIEDLETLRAGYLSRLHSIAPGASTITDKTPANFYYLGLIQRLFPTAQIVHCLRHPLDTCLSIYFQLFNSIEYAYDLRDIGDHYIEYDTLMAHWRETINLNQFEIHYERLVTRPEESIPALLASCDLPWEQQCLTPNTANRSINTMSRWQARQPLYRHAVQRWQRYDSHLGGLKQMLASVRERYADSPD